MKAFSLGQQFGEMLLVKAHVSRLGEFQHAPDEIRSECVSRAPSPVSVHQSGCPDFPVSRQKTAQLP